REFVDPLAAGAGVVVLADEVRERQAEQVFVEVPGLLGVLAAVGPVVQALDGNEPFHGALLTLCRRGAPAPAACRRRIRARSPCFPARPCSPWWPALPGAPAPCRCRRRGGSRPPPSSRRHSRSPSGCGAPSPSLSRSRR